LKQKIVDELPEREALAKRCRGHCEVCGNPPTWTGLHPHEVVKRAKQGELSMGNSLMCCSRCHDHSQFGSGLCISKEEALALIAKLNKEADNEDSN